MSWYYHINYDASILRIEDEKCRRTKLHLNNFHFISPLPENKKHACSEVSTLCWTKILKPVETLRMSCYKFASEAIFLKDIYF
jgi:hypothetical protein